MPVKKRKLEEKVLGESLLTSNPGTPQDFPWVGLCKQSDKQSILDHKYLCSDIMNTVQNLLQSQFPDINGLQETNLAPVKSNGKWVSNKGFLAQDAPSVQIHHNGTDHWVVSLQTSSKEIYFLDSMGLKVNTSLEYQLSEIYGQNKKNLSVKIPEVQKQEGCSDCGLFAIAFALEFCLTGFKGGTHIKFEQKYMRDHLIQCLEKGHFSQFPKKTIGRAPPLY